MKIILLFLIILYNSLYSQEVLNELTYNSKLLDNKKFRFLEKSSIDIPFIDDFSYNSTIPDSNLWIDNYVYVNQQYPINPVTIGVATFDGLDENGRAYDIYTVLNSSHGADTLTSQKIDLSQIDTAFIMFYYQKQGLGNDPQIEDSLFLEFALKDSIGNIIWNTIWREEGGALTEFNKFSYVFTNTEYLVSDFQFRFRNLATLSGNFDHWHIDYVKLDVFDSSFDTLSLDDISFVDKTPNLLKRYTEMPWVHYVNNISNELNDSLTITIRNNTTGIQSIDYRYDIFNLNGNLLFHYPIIGGNNSSRNVDVPPYDYYGNYILNSPHVMLYDQMFPITSQDSASFIVRNLINTPPGDNKVNDTLINVQKFFSHFSYDDGSEESAYGINVNGAKIAYEFKLNRPDSLRVIQVKFVEMNEDLTNTDFILKVWDYDNGEPGILLYADTVKLSYDNRGKFTNYYLEEGVGLVGSFFIGIEQINSDVLNIGLDKNNNSNDYMLYNIGNGWFNSQFSGSWMIRPVFNYDKPLINHEIEDLIFNCKIYPNPFSNQSSVMFSEEKYRRFNIIDISGRICQSFISSNSELIIDRKRLKNGVYILQILEGNRVYNRKILIH
tara:strand:+ start:22066 stop:23892 length:1827 start_codon:yes stop_codon:yes gene_type:complete